MRVEMHAGDMKPDLRVLCSDSLLPVDLTEADSVRVVGKMDGVVIFDRPPTGMVVTGGLTEVTMEWQPADVSRVGRMSIAVIAVWPGSKPQTFEPNDKVIFERAVV